MEVKKFNKLQKKADKIQIKIDLLEYEISIHKKRKKLIWDEQNRDLLPNPNPQL